MRNPGTFLVFLLAALGLENEPLCPHLFVGAAPPSFPLSLPFFLQALHSSSSLFLSHTPITSVLHFETNSLSSICYFSAAPSWRRNNGALSDKCLCTVRDRETTFIHWSGGRQGVCCMEVFIVMFFSAVVITYACVIIKWYTHMPDQSKHSYSSSLKPLSNQPLET